METRWGAAERRTDAVAFLAAALVAVGLAAALVLGAAQGATSRTLGVLVLTGLVEVLVATSFAFRATAEPGDGDADAAPDEEPDGHRSRVARPRSRLVAPAAVLAAVAWTFFVCVLVLGSGL